MEHYFVYLDEFGHVGPYVSKNDPRHKTSPIFGLGGFYLPVSQVRTFSSFFYNLKNDLLKYDLDNSEIPPYQWEKKGATLFREKNVKKYPELRRAAFRIFREIESRKGSIFYVGLKKYLEPEEFNSEKLYLSVLSESIKRLDGIFLNKGSFSIVMDQVCPMGKMANLRTNVVAKASLEMYGENHRRSLIEPPLQVESNLYQTIQCADWICALIGRLYAYRVSPNEYPENKCFELYFYDRLKKISKRCGIRTKTPSRMKVKS